jgi:hypothetical protein
MIITIKLEGTYRYHARVIFLIYFLQNNATIKVAYPSIICCHTPFIHPYEVALVLSPPHGFVHTEVEMEGLEHKHTM